MGTKWINFARNYNTAMLVSFTTDITSVSQMAVELTRVNVSDVVLGDLDKWISNILFFPFNINVGSGSPLTVGGITYDDIKVNMLDVGLDFGLDLGEYYYEATFNDFRDYEPYTKLQIFLPYYNYVTIPIIDVLNKYIQFRLFIDFKTGKAQYVIGVTETSLVRRQKTTFFNSVIQVDDTNTRIIAKYDFQMASTIPVGKTGMADAVRSSSIMGLTAIGSLALGGLLQSKATTTTDTTKTISTITKDKGIVNNRLRATSSREITSSVSGTTKSTTSSNYNRINSINQCFNSSMSAIQNMHLDAHIGVAQNAVLDVTSPHCIKIVVKKALFGEYGTPNYNHLYGRPLGETRILNSLKGYTEISTIHFENENFKYITSEERSMLEQIFTSGVIL